MTPEPVGTGTFRILETFRRNASDDVLEAVGVMTSRALADFPELSGETVTIARLDPDDVADGTRGRAGMLNRIMYLPTDRPTTYVTIYHELGHLAIEILDAEGEDVPTTSEEFCSIFSMARMPPGRVDEDRVPYLGEPAIRRERFPGVCEKALEYREENHDYIKTCSEWLGVGDDEDRDK